MRHWAIFREADMSAASRTNRPVRPFPVWFLTGAGVMILALSITSGILRAVRRAARKRVVT
jgi:hypothetical protein